MVAEVGEEPEVLQHLYGRISGNRDLIREDGGHRWRPEFLTTVGPRDSLTTLASAHALLVDPLVHPRHDEQKLDLEAKVHLRLGKRARANAHP